jgi:hypothetical protein
MPGAVVTGATANVFTVSANCRFYNLMMQINSSGTENSCIARTTGDIDIVIENCILKTVIGPTNGSKAINFTGSGLKSAVIRNNIFDCAGTAINIGALADTLTIENNNIIINTTDDNDDYGISVTSYSAMIKNNRICISSSGDGNIVALKGLSLTKLLDNTVYVTTSGDGNVLMVDGCGYIRNNILQAYVTGSGDVYGYKSTAGDLQFLDNLFIDISTLKDPVSTTGANFGAQIGDLSNAYLKDNGITHNKFFNKEV